LILSKVDRWATRISGARVGLFAALTADASSRILDTSRQLDDFFASGERLLSRVPSPITSDLGRSQKSLLTLPDIQDSAI
jgi:hypothetical protein